jgi:uncharacterized protein (DUF885 family)
LRLLFSASPLSPCPTPRVAQPAAAEQRVAATQSINGFFADFTSEWVRNDPNLARRTHYFTGPEQDRLERQITPRTKAFRQARIERAKSGLARLRTFDRTAMSESERMSADLMQWQLQTIVDEEPFLDDTFPLEQFGGANLGLVNTLVVAHPIRSQRDGETYIAALSEVTKRMREVIGEARRLEANGIVPPRFILQATIEQMQRFIATPPDENPFVATLARKLGGVVSSEMRDGFAAQAERIVASDIYPAWRDAIALLKAQMARASDEAGLSRLPNGGAAYAYFLRLFTTTNMTADQIHELGLRQVDAIQGQMDQLLRRLGYNEGSVKDRIEKLRQNRAYPNPASEASRAQVMRDIEDILRDAQVRAVLLFDRTPKAAVIAQPYPEFQEANAQASYSSPPADGFAPRHLPVSTPRRKDDQIRSQDHRLSRDDSRPSFPDRTRNRKQRPAGVPAAADIRGLSAPIEGWGLYAEHLAAESGWYGNDLEGLLGQLFWEEFRARRLVVDTGLHAKHWTRQQAIDYGIEPAEVERYVVTPGQASSYMIGELKILELREKARRALGDRFSLKDFHSMVLTAGALPLEMLERETDAFIARNRAP